MYDLANITSTQTITGQTSSKTLFIGADKKPITAHQWLAQVSLIRQQLQQMPQQTWLLYHGDIVAFSQGFFALLLAGKRIVLPPSDKPEQLKAIVHSSNQSSSTNSNQSIAPIEAILGSATVEGLTKLTLQTSDVRSKSVEVDSVEADSVEVDSAKGKQHSLSQSPSQLIAAQTQIDFFTSGSTGAAKRVTKSWRQLATEVQDLESLWGDALGQSQIINSVSHQHVYGLLFGLLWPLLNQRVINTTFIHYPENLEQQLALLEDQQQLCLVASPALLTRTFDLPLWQHHQAKLIQVFSSGGPLPLQAATAILPQPIEVFGSTETGGIAWRKQGQNIHWQPFASVKCKLDDHSQRLMLQSPYLPEQFTPDGDHWYLCDDTVTFDENGHFKLLGRADRIVKIEEKRLSLDELEQALLHHQWISQCRAVVLPGLRVQVAMVVVLTAKGQAELDEHGKRQMGQQLRLNLSERFEAILLPRKWRYVPQMPQNHQGKLINQQLLALFE